MIPYGNTSSGVEAYEIGNDCISIKFKNTSKIYTYPVSRNSAGVIEQMANLARQGRGLQTYINQHKPNWR